MSLTLFVLVSPYLLENLKCLRCRGVGAKRSLASREFALEIKPLERFVRREPLPCTKSVCSECWLLKANRGSALVT